MAERQATRACVSEICLTAKNDLSLGAQVYLVLIIPHLHQHLSIGIEQKIKIIVHRSSKGSVIIV
jgi:hypothetical protein